MNIELLEQFGQNYPQEFDGNLDSVTHSTVGVFNRRGSVLAVGCNDGRVCIWDFMTRGIAKVIWAHVQAVTSLSWSRNGKLLATSSNDCYVCVWDVLTSECIIQWHLNTSIFFIQFSPRNDKILLIRRMKEPSMLVQYQLDSNGTIQSKTHTYIPRDDESEFDVVSSFDRRGEYVYSGNTKGRIQVHRLKPGTIELTFVTSFRVSNTAIKQIEFAPKNKDLFLVNSSDRTIRIYSTSHVLSTVQDNSVNSSAAQNTSRGRKLQGNSTNTTDLRVDQQLEPIQKLQDLVNRTTWKKCCFSGGLYSDYVCAGSARANAVYIWDRNMGSLVKILAGAKGESITDVLWHPIRPVVAVIVNGVLSIWTQPQVENWSAFAPDFKELEENIEYEERESEFDELDEDRTPTRVDPDESIEEETVIDVVTPHTIDIFLSSDEEGEDSKALIYFPISVDIDDAEMEATEESLFDDNIPSNLAHKVNGKEKTKPEDVPKPLHPKNRIVPTVEL
ncbi:Retinoblastoma-binding protein 5 [Blomia tropicalis]|nr:Retinoblastoma-binding protein 5 [Blomia tropicalis]